MNHVKRFTEVVHHDEAMDLAEAALLIAQLEYPDLDIACYLHCLDHMACRAKTDRAGRDSLRQLHRLREFLFTEEGFHGNAGDYYDPRNSFLNDVIDRKLGIPITLSVIFMEVGRRLGLTIEGVGLPGHFIVRFQEGRTSLLIDPFHQGAILSPGECEELAARALKGPFSLEPGHFLPLSKRQILTRILNNLKGIYLRREEWEHALRIIEWIRVLAPDDPVEFRDRGIVFAHLENYNRAVTDWEEYLRRVPRASDAETIREHLRRLRQILASRN